MLAEYIQQEVQHVQHYHEQVGPNKWLTPPCPVCGTSTEWNDSTNAYAGCHGSAHHHHHHAHAQPLGTEGAAPKRHSSASSVSSAEGVEGASNSSTDPSCATTLSSNATGDTTPKTRKKHSSHKKKHKKASSHKKSHRKKHSHGDDSSAGPVSTHSHSHASTKSSATTVWSTPSVDMSTDTAVHLAGAVEGQILNMGIHQAGDGDSNSSRKKEKKRSHSHSSHSSHHSHSHSHHSHSHHSSHSRSSSQKRHSSRRHKSPITIHHLVSHDYEARYCSPFGGHSGSPSPTASSTTGSPGYTQAYSAENGKGIMHMRHSHSSSSHANGLIPGSPSQGPLSHRHLEAKERRALRQLRDRTAAATEQHAHGDVEQKEENKYSSMYNARVSASSPQSALAAAAAASLTPMVQAYFRTSSPSSQQQQQQGGGGSSSPIQQSPPRMEPPASPPPQGHSHSQKPSGAVNAALAHHNMQMRDKWAAMAAREHASPPPRSTSYPHPQGQAHPHNSNNSSSHPHGHHSHSHPHSKHNGYGELRPSSPSNMSTSSNNSSNSALTPADGIAAAFKEMKMHPSHPHAHGRPRLQPPPPPHNSHDQFPSKHRSYATQPSTGISSPYRSGTPSPPRHRDPHYSGQFSSQWKPSPTKHAYVVEPPHGGGGYDYHSSYSNGSPRKQDQYFGGLSVSGANYSSDTDNNRHSSRSGYSRGGGGVDVGYSSSGSVSDYPPQMFQYTPRDWQKDVQRNQNEHRLMDDSRRSSSRRSKSPPPITLHQPLSSQLQPPPPPPPPPFMMNNDNADWRSHSHGYSDQHNNHGDRRSHHDDHHDAFEYRMGRAPTDDSDGWISQSSSGDRRSGSRHGRSALSPSRGGMMTPPQYTHHQPPDDHYNKSHNTLVNPSHFERFPTQHDDHHMLPHTSRYSPPKKSPGGHHSSPPFVPAGRACSPPYITQNTRHGSPPHSHHYNSYGGSQHIGVY
eukprot:TRINITY_DN68131_c1_g1_i1.p1 TRINITY_DN68131_c1_g1~~TRINITY_DN68131_c1_g1_i1.p1  ORF type:complete len:969 (-),score=88.05 TRINITY_DN68131_c1_g1_i1:644-3529(-)